MDFLRIAARVAQTANPVTAAGGAMEDGWEDDGNGNLRKFWSQGEGVHSSGDPKSDGYEVQMMHALDKGGTGTEYHVNVNGMWQGKHLGGTLTVHVADGSFDGWDWNDMGDESDPTWIDVSTDPEGALQAVLDAVAEDLGLS